MHVSCTWLECEESVQMETAVSREYLVDKTFSRDTCETFCFARLYYLIHTFCTYTIYTHITHKWEGEPLRENPSKNTWELEIVISTFLHTFVCGISSSPTSPFPYHWEVDSPNTYHTIFWVSSDRLVLLGSIGRSQGWQMKHGACCGIRRTRQDTVPRSLFGVGAWRA